MARRQFGQRPPRIWSRIQQLLRARAWTAADLARASGVTPASISRWAKGHNEPERESLEKIATALGISVDQLLGPRALPRSIPTAQVERLTDKERLVLEAYRKDDEARGEIDDVLERIARLRVRLRQEMVEEREKDDSNGTAKD